MDINSYRSRVDTQPVQINRTDSIPSDSIRITKFFIDFDEDGQPFEAFSTQQQTHLSQHDKGDYAEEPSRHRKIYKAGTVQNKIKQSNTIGGNKMQNNKKLITENIQEKIKLMSDVNTYGWILPKIARNVFRDAQTITSEIIKENPDAKKFVDEFDVYFLISHFTNLIGAPALNKFIIEPYMKECMKYYKQKREIYDRQHPQQTNESIPTKTNEVKIQGNPLIQRTLRNLKSSGDLKPSKIILECDMAKPAISIRKKQVIQIRDQNGNMIRVIDKATSPELYNQICGGTTEQFTQPEYPQQFSTNTPQINTTQYDEQVDDTQQFDNGFDTEYAGYNQDDEQRLHLNQHNRHLGDGLRNHPFAGFGVSNIPIITPPMFNGKMFENLQKTVQDIDKLITQNTETIDGKNIRKKKNIKH